MKATRCLLASLALAALSVFPVAAFGGDQPQKVGVIQRAFAPSGDYNWRGAATHALVTVIWYPADSGAVEKDMWIGPPDHPLVSAGKAAQNARLSPSGGSYPLIVLSHGTGGSALMMSWLGRELAAHGYIAAAVNHPGNNALEQYTVQGFTLWWERARDLSTVIDSMLADPVLGTHIDRRRIGAAGFSLGGYTMMEIAGGRTNLDVFTSYCAANPNTVICSDPPEFPGLVGKSRDLAASDSLYRKALGQATASFCDPRVRAVFAIAPALGPAFDVQSLEKIAIPTAIVAGDSDRIVPVTENAAVFAKHIPHAALTVLPGGVGHYTFLGSCTDAGRAALPALCVDFPGVDRNAVHAKTVGLALDFFGTHLK